jgi:hypothetical protein
MVASASQSVNSEFERAMNMPSVFDAANVTASASGDNESQVESESAKVSDGLPVTEDGTPLLVVKSRSVMFAISSAMSSAFGGAHVEMNITEEEAKALPQLNPKNDRQYKWIQYMVWRKWMMVTALIVSIIICGVTTCQILVQMNHLWDVVERCESGDSNTILDPAEHATGHSGKKLNRMAVLEKLMKPVGGSNFRSYRHKCAPPVSEAVIPSFAVGEALQCDEMMTDNYEEVGGELMLGECKWFPFIPWTKTPPSPPAQSACSDRWTSNNVPYYPGDCVQNAAAVSDDVHSTCDGRFYNLDLYVQTDRSMNTYTFEQGSCVIGESCVCGIIW